jgi:hypothetical protein
LFTKINNQPPPPSNSEEVPERQKSFGCNRTIRKRPRNYETSFQFVINYNVLAEERKLLSSKVKFTLEQAMKVQRGSRGIALLFL